MKGNQREKKVEEGGRDEGQKGAKRKTRLEKLNW